ASLVLQQVAQILSREQPEQRSAPRKHGGELEVDQRRRPALGLEPVRLLREIVVDDARAMHAPEQAERRAEKGRVAGAGDVQRRARQVLAEQHAAVEARELRYPDNTS